MYLLNEWHGTVQAYSSQVTDDDFTQPKELWKVFKREGVDEEFIHNVIGHMSGAIKEVQDKAIGVWAQVDQEIADRIREALDGDGLKEKDSDHAWTPRKQDS